jgi:TatD DNase family protein
MLIDSHSHLNFNAYKDDVDEVIQRSLNNNVWMINVGSQYSTSERAVKIAEKYQKGVYASIGLHPVHLAEGIFKIKMDEEEVSFQTKKETFSFEKYRQLAVSEKVVAIGEAGLDYWYKPKSKSKQEQFKNKQKEELLKQIDLAEELDLPMIFHCRVAHSDLIEILEKRVGRTRGVVHCFTGKWQEAQRYLEMGFFLGFNGIIFKLNLKEIIEKAPLNKILVETDCPYLIPPVEEANKRNEPLYVKHVAKEIARIKKIDYNEVAKTTTENTLKLFSINS